MEEDFARRLVAHYILEDFGRLMGRFPGRLLKYNALEDNNVEYEHIYQNNL